MFNAFLLCFALLCGCRSVGRVTQEDFPSVWFPPEAEGIYGENSIVAEREWKRCGDGYYIGFSIYNMDRRKLQTCKSIGDGNTMCAYYFNYDVIGAYDNDPYVAVFNIKYNQQGVVYGCKAHKMMGYAY